MSENFDIAVRVLARVLEGYDEALVRETVEANPNGSMAAKVKFIAEELELLPSGAALVRSPPFSDRVVILRRRLGISQESLAAKLDISFATVNRWESGKTQPQGAHRKAFDRLWEKTGFGVVDQDLKAPRIRRGMKRSKVLK